MIGRKLTWLIVLLAIQLDGFCSVSNFYIEIFENEVAIGRYSPKSFQENEIERICLEKINTTNILEALQLGEKEEKVLFYFHAMWGGVKPYHKNSLKILNRKLKNIDKIISIVWHANSVQYKTNWRNSIISGETISPLIDSIILNTQNNYLVLCHSMGNRVFEGIVCGFNGKARRFETVILAGADLEVDVFKKGLSMLPDYCDQIVLYVNKKDRLLKFSRFLHKRERLGLDAAKYLDELSKIKNLEIVNVTHSDSWKPISVSNHIYFKNNKAVVQDINLLVSDELASRELTSQTDNYFELK